MKSGQVIKVKVKAGVSKTEVLSTPSDTVDYYVIALKAPAQDGKANEALQKLIKKKTGCESQIISGKTSKLKMLRLL